PRILRLQTIERAALLGTPEKRRATLLAIRVGVVALREVAGAAVRAVAAPHRRRDHDSIASPEISDAAADLGHDPHRLVTQNGAGLHPRHGTPDHVQIGAADRTGRYV